MNRIITISLALSVLGCSHSEAEGCVEERYPVQMDEPGPWEVTPDQVFSHATGPRSGTWVWNGGGEVLDVDPDDGEVPFSASLTLTADAAEVVDLTKVGKGRLACLDRMEIPARLELVTEDGAVAEALDVTAVGDGSFANPVLVTVDLLETPLAGTLTFAPKAGVSFAEEGIFLVVRWDENGDGLVRGEMFYGGQSESVQSDGTVGGEGVVHRFAGFMGAYP